MKIVLVQPYHGCNHYACIAVAADVGLDSAAVGAHHGGVEIQFRAVGHIGHELKGK